ncbi:MAG: EamA family transporter [Syntrophobacteraceae bacterium]|nr:EamA family transporter [Syntrophobacteraceae bacterium]
MQRTNPHALGLALFCILLAVVGQTLMKLAIVRSGGMPVLEIGVEGLARKFIEVPYILLGFAAYGASAILWLQVLTDMDFSVAFPLVSISYVLALFVGRFLFDENVNFYRILGVALICSGVFFVIRSQ